VTEARSLGPDYRRFWFAAAASNLGDGIRLGAIPLLAIRLTDDARLVAATSAVTLLPWFLFGAVGGAIVDRGDRRRLMLIGQLTRAALVGALALSVATDTATIGWLLVVGLGLGTGEVIVDSVSQAAVPRLVAADQLDLANSRLIAAVTVLEQVVGVTFGALLFAVATDLPFWVDAATFLVGAAFLASIRRPLQGERTERNTIRNDIADGFRFLFGHRLLRSLVGAVSTINLALNVSFGVVVILVVDEFDATEGMFGIVLGVAAVGGVLGSLLAEMIIIRFGRGFVLSVSPVLLALSQVGNAVAPDVSVVAAALFVASFAVVVSNVAGQSLRQAVAPEHLLGRVVVSFRVFGMEPRHWVRSSVASWRKPSTSGPRWPSPRSAWSRAG
jgi:MFS family permease